MSIVPIPVGSLETNAYLAISGGEAIIVDPGGDPQRIAQAVKRSGVSKIVAIVLTHGHFDHAGAVAELKKATGAPVLMHPLDVPLYRVAPQQARLFGCPPFAVQEIDRHLAAGGSITFGRAVLKVIHTPGHTPGGICLFGEGHLFSGDTLFAGSIGRSDLPGGSSRDLMESIRRHLMPLPDATEVHPGHGPRTTMAREKRSNPFLTGLR
jgi:glyoxylase-like metal-dependent hydrolase (beta-lactamase superfamily II)